MFRPLSLMEEIEIRMRFLRARLAALTTAAELTPMDW